MFLNKSKKRKTGVFHFIAPVYGLFYDYQKRHYNSVFERIQNEVNFSKYKSIIDVGCGTGALCSVFNQRGFVVTGIDPVEKMLNIAMNKRENRAIEFIQASVLERLPFEDKSFDVSIASYVAHGLNKHDRKIMYDEMSRITKHLVIIYDYNENRSGLIDMVEMLEGGDYFNFIRKAKLEMKKNFQEVRIINAASYATWYICVPY